MSVKTTDVIPGIDPTGYASISGADLYQLVAGLNVETDKGMVIVTTDVGGNPVVPDGLTNTKFQRYMWMRISPASTSVSLYVWNPNGAGTGFTPQLWESVTSASIGTGSIQGYMIADNTITKEKIENITMAQVIGLTTAGYITTTSTPAIIDIAGDFLSGFTIQNNAVTELKIATDAVTTGKIKAKNVTAAKIEGGTDTQILQTHGASKDASWTTPNAIVTGLSNPAGAGDNDKVVAVDNGASGASSTYKHLTTAQLIAIIDSVRVIPTIRAGTVSVVGGATGGAVTFSSAMPSANYRVSLCLSAGITDNTTCLYTDSKTTAGFKAYLYDYTGTVNVDYIAVLDI